MIYVYTNTSYIVMREYFNLQTELVFVLEIQHNFTLTFAVEKRSSIDKTDKRNGIENT